MSADVQAIVGAGTGVVAAVIGAWAALRARHSSASKVEVVDVSSAPFDASRSQYPAINLDVKLRNTGAQPAVLTRLTVCVVQAAAFHDLIFLPYDTSMVQSGLGVSGEYGIVLPEASGAVGARVTINLAQVIAGAEADRFLVTLNRQDGGRATGVYLLRLEIWHDTNARPVTSVPIAVALPQSGICCTPEWIRQRVERFVEGVHEVRQAIDQEMVASGRVTPDWDADPPRSRAELPSPLRAVDGIDDGWFDDRYGDDLLDPYPPGTFWVTERFWDPLASIDSYLNSFEEYCRKLVDILGYAHPTDEFLQDRYRHAQVTLSQLPRLRREITTALRL